MKILIVTPWFPYHAQDQEGNFILDSAQSLVEVGHEVTILITRVWRPWFAGIINSKWRRKKFREDNFSSKLNLYTCYYLSIPRHFFYSLTCWHYKKHISRVLEKIVTKHDIQIVHAQTELAGTAVVETANKFNLSSLITLHGISTEEKLYRSPTKQLLFVNPLNTASRIILVGKPLFDFAKQFVDSTQHFRIVPNGFRCVADDRESPVKNWQQNNLNFISVSNLVEGKGIDINLHALKQLKNLGISNWTYKVIGDGDERANLQKLTKDLNLEAHVHFIGAVNHNEVYQHLEAAHAFILPSYREAFGIAYLEAMSSGLLTIGVEGQGPDAFIENGKTGFLIKPKDINNLVNLLKNIFSERAQMQIIAQAGKHYVRHTFTWNKHALELTKLYAEIITK